MDLDGKNLPIFPDVEYVGVSKLRVLSKASVLRELKRPVVIMAPQSDAPLAVLIPYDQYLVMQRVVFCVSPEILAKVVNYIVGAPVLEPTLPQ